MMSNPHPSRYGLPHDEWRPGQLETVKWVSNTPGTLLIQAPTGSGKTAIASAISTYGSVRSLTHTINLQQQYEKLYGFDTIYGMRHYPCAFVNDTDTAANCSFAEKMFDCPVAVDCEYLIQREIVRKATKQSLSYAYFLQAVWPKLDSADMLYCDEAHLLPQITKDFCTIEYTTKQIFYMDVPMYPTVKLRGYQARTLMAVKWLQKIRLKMQDDHGDLVKVKPKYRSHNLKTRIRLLTEQIYRLGRTIAYAEKHPEEFYTNWNKDYFKMMPLSAKLYFKDLFINKFDHKPVLTSATIGNPDTLARELGLSNYSFRDVPSAYPPEAMPVFTFDDAPKLSYKSSPMDWRKWADVIGRAVNMVNSEWSGLIHVSSGIQAESLANALSRSEHGLQDRVYIPEGKGTKGKILDWKQRKLKVPNTIAIAYSFHMGLDAYDDEINIVGKIPYGILDEFGMAELNYDAGIYRHKAALLTEQACGRIRRGQPEHYEEPGEPMRKIVAIADNNYIGIVKEFSKHFQDCITPM